jgi:NTP pyrophosphatase (non-canonical NTP hydrolase)
MSGHGDFSIGSNIWPGISKLIEEAGEVIQVSGKLIASHGESAHFDGSDLRERLADELGDLIAAIEFVEDHNQLDVDRIRQRIAAKRALFEQWHRG